MEQGSIAWDSSLTLKTVKSRVVLCGTEHYYMGQNHSHLGQYSLMWERAVSRSREQFNVGQSSVMWYRAVSCGTEESNVQQEQNGVLRDKAALYGTISLNISPAIVPEV